MREFMSLDELKRLVDIIHKVALRYMSPETVDKFMKDISIEMKKEGHK